MSTNYLTVKNLKVSKNLLSFINEELLKGIEISQEKFWSKFPPPGPKMSKNRSKVENEIT